MAVTDVVDVCHDDSGKIDSVDGGVDCDVDFSEDGCKDGVMGDNFFRKSSNPYFENI